MRHHKDRRKTHLLRLRSAHSQILHANLQKAVSLRFVDSTDLHTTDNFYKYLTMCVEPVTINVTKLSSLNYGV